MTQGDPKTQDLLKERIGEALIPELRTRAGRLIKYTKRMMVEVHDRLRHLTVFKPVTKHQGESELFEFTDKAGRVFQFPIGVDKKGWDIQGTSIYNYLVYLHKFVTFDKLQAKLEDALQGQKKHLSFHKRVIDRNPIIGYSWLLARNFANKLSESTEKIAQDQGVKNKNIERFNEAARYERSLNQAENVLCQIDSVFENLEQRVNDPLTHSFLRDLKLDCELLIYDVCNAAFGIFHLFLDEIINKNIGLPYIVVKSSYPISMRDYSQREDQIIQLRNCVASYESELVLSEFPMPHRDRIRAEGIIELPSVIASDDLKKLLDVYQSFWSELATRLCASDTFHFRGTHAQLSSFHEIGIQGATSGVQARLAFRVPGFNLRVDRDERNECITLDAGSASIDYVLAGVEKFFSAFMAQTDKAPSAFSNLIELEQKSVLLEHQVAYLVSALMALSRGEHLRSNATLSHHSREHIAQQEYYDNFEHILKTLRQGLEKK